jgi:hypothetical protein
MLECEFNRLFKMNKPMNLTEADKEDFRKAHNCRFCEQPLGNDRVRDHCRMTGRTQRCRPQGLQLALPPPQLDCTRLLP